MRGINFILIAVLFILPLAIISCDVNNGPQGYPSPFEVIVTDTVGNPLEGAILEGGLDWDDFWVTTDSQGRAMMPETAYDASTVIKKNDYFSIIRSHLREGVYVLTPTPKRLVDKGPIEGELLRFDSDKIFTLNYQADYRVYDFDGDNLAENRVVELPGQVEAFKLIDNRLWYTTQENGIHVYSLDDPLDPVELFHLDISGNLRAFAVKDSLVAVAHPYSQGPIRLFSFHTDGTVNELDQIRDFYVSKLYFLGDYLITTGYNMGYTIFSVADPSDIRMVYNRYVGGTGWSFLRSDTLIVAPDYDYYSYTTVDLSDPGNPREMASIRVTGQIDFFLDDSSAMGDYNIDSKSLCVFDRTSATNFDAVAMISEIYWNPQNHGGNPPYYLMIGRLWKMEDWQ